MIKPQRLRLILALLTFTSVVLSQTTPEIYIQMGHVGSFSVYRSVAFSHSGTLLASSGGGNDIKVWNVDMQRELRTFAGHTNGVTSLAFLPNDLGLISAGMDGAIILWDIATGQRVRTFEQTQALIFDIGVSTDGSLLMACESEYVKLWNIRTGRLLWTVSFKSISDPYTFGSAVFSPDSKNIVVGSRTKGVTLLSTSDGSVQTRVELPGVFDPVVVGFSGDRTSLVQAYGEVAAIDLARKTVQKTKLPHPVRKMSEDGKFLLCWEGVSPKEVAVLEASSFGQIGKTAFDYDIRDIALSPDARYLAIADGKNGIKVYDGRSGQRLGNLESIVKQPRSVSVSADGKLLSYHFDPYADSVSIHAGLMRGVFSLANSSFVKEYSEKARNKQIQDFLALRTDAGLKRAQEMIDDAKYIDACSETPLQYDTTRRKFYFAKAMMFTPSVTLFEADPENPEEAAENPAFALHPTASNTDVKWRRVTSFSHHTGPIGPVTLSLSKKLILTGGEDNTIRLVEFPTGTLLYTFNGHTGKINHLTFTADGNRFVSSSDDGTVRLWDLRTRKEVARFVSFRDGDWIVIVPEGYFNASSGGAKHLNVRIGTTVYSMDNFFETYFRPDIVNALLGGANFADLSLEKKITDGIKSPPKVSLFIMRTNGEFKPAASRDDKDVKLTNGTVEVKVTAANSGGGIYGVRLFNNGKAVGEDVRGMKQVTTTEGYERRFTVGITNGENTLRVIGISDDLSESDPVTATVVCRTGSTAVPNMYILAIGINEYRNKKYNLNYCADDLKGFVESITPPARKIFGKINTTILVNREANRQNTIKAFETLKASVNPDDVFVLFYAGHGIALQRAGASTGDKKEFYYILTDVTQMTDPAKAEQDGLSGSEMKRQLSEIRATKQVLFIDACNSGAFTEQYAMRGAAEENALAKLSRSTGSVIFASTTKEQYAAEFRELRHGVFTYVLMDALKGNACLPDGQLTVASLKAFIDENIPAVTKKYKGEEQFPTSFIWGQDFPIGLGVKGK